MTTQNLLVELFVEELPPKALRKLGAAFADLLFASLQAQGLTTEKSGFTAYASPRRLGAHITAVAAQAADQAVLHKLMPVSVGLTAAGEATPALLKKLSGVGADASVIPQLKRQMEGKAEALFFDSRVTGATLVAGLQKALDEALTKLPIPKVMQYQLADGWSSVKFVRPAHGLVALHGSEVVRVSVLGLRAGRQTRGHRFEASVDPIELKDADHYAQQLETQGAVIASFEARRDEVRRQLLAAAAKQGLTLIDDAALLDEVTALVERPNVVVCGFERAFLEVPHECLILTMKANQKYFPLLDAAGKLTNQFLVVSNIRPADPSRVIEGNERVVRPRLADAKFFFDQDRRKTLESRVAGLDNVVYHGKLGTQGERVVRVRAIARAIGERLGGEVLANQADRAAMLAKADLLTDMVGEFPELQGTMGGYYARHDGESDAVATAIEDHYKPRFSGDALPREVTGTVAALADKLETLVGMFGIGQVPTGDKDPYALRRQALGVIRLLTDKLPELPLDAALDIAMSRPQWPPDVRKVFSDTGVVDLQRTQLLQFFKDRLTVALGDMAFTPHEVAAVLADDKFWRLAEVPRRLAAVRDFVAMPEAQSLAAANKRVGNILKKAETSVVVEVNPALLTEPAEKALYEALGVAKPKADAAFDGKDYTGSLRALAVLKAPVDAFFDAVMVNAEEPALRANRLGLLATLHAAMNRIADLSKLAT